MKNPELQSETIEPITAANRRVLMRSALAFGLACIAPTLATAEAPKELPAWKILRSDNYLRGPSWQLYVTGEPPEGGDQPYVGPPATLERRMAELGYFVIIGTPRRFLYIPTGPYGTHRIPWKWNADRSRRIREAPPKTAYEKFYEANPVDADTFRLREESEIEGQAYAFLEFDIESVLFQRDQSAKNQMGTANGRVYFEVGPVVREPGEYKEAWHAHLGKKVILLTNGVHAPTPYRFIALPFPVHQLAVGWHWLDQMPIPLEELPRVSEIAHRLGFVRVNKK